MAITIDSLIPPSVVKRYTTIEFSAETLTVLRTHPEKYALQIKLKKTTKVSLSTGPESELKSQQSTFKKALISH